MTSEKNNAGSDGAVECGDKDRDEILQTIGEAIGKLEAGEAVEIPKVRPQEAQFDSGRHFMPRSTVNWSVSRDCGRRFLALLRSIEDILNGGEKVLQRDHFYRLGSNYDAFKDDGPLADPYEALTGNYIRRIEGLTGAERQNLGLLGGGRGYIWSPRGRMSTTKRKDVDLADAPAIRNDIRRSTLVDAPDIVVSVEKPGVQEVLENSGIAEVLDFMVVVPRGRTNRAALRFLKERERDGKRIFSLNDGDVVGLKIPLEMKGLSKRGAHLGDDFRPNVDHIGVYGRALSHAGIDGITENNMNKLEDGLVKARNLGKDRILAELKNIERTGKRWETAALDPYDKGLETYLIEAFRAFGVYDDRLFDPDEISPKTVRGKVPDLIWEHIETRGDIDAGNLAGETLCKREEEIDEYRTRVHYHPSVEARDKIDDWIEDKAEEYLDVEGPDLPDEKGIKEKVKNVLSTFSDELFPNLAIEEYNGDPLEASPTDDSVAETARERMLTLEKTVEGEAEYEIDSHETPEGNFKVEITVKKPNFEVEVEEPEISGVEDPEPGDVTTPYDYAHDKLGTDDGFATKMKEGLKSIMGETVS